MPFNLNAWKRVQGLADVTTDIHTACKNRQWQKVIRLLKEKGFQTPQSLISYRKDIQALADLINSLLNSFTSFSHN